MAIGQQSFLDILPFVVECKSTNLFFETIAAFDCRAAAEAYAAEGRIANPRFTYKVTVPCPKIDNASEIERRIAGKVVTLLLEAGYLITVSAENEEIVLERSNDADKIFAALASSSFDTLQLTGNPNARRSFVDLVWGNEVDVISDYGMSLEDVLKPALDLAETLDVRGN